MPWEIYVVCSNGHGVDAYTYHLLSTVIDLEGLMDLLEMKECQVSWQHAEMNNREWAKNLPK